ncbi:MAG: DUF4143 domain-containing protein [Actinomycetaceae bacterium]|nr:DUF4143 domain-containing protein [Actinomycetaceae bacterium]
MSSYHSRVSESELQSLMSVTGAVLIEGPKACGKTTTATRLAKTRFDMDEDSTAKASVELNPDFLFNNPTPILFDEWQVVPDVWNRVRRAVDARSGQRGLYILTGSSTPRDNVNRHSGAGRFSVLQMRTMSLFETHHSTGDVSFKALMDGETCKGSGNHMNVPELMERIVIGGWPHLLGQDETTARKWLAGYIKQAIEVDIPSFVGHRDPNTLGRVLESLARFVAHSPALTSIAADAGGAGGPLNTGTLRSHLDALQRLHLLDNSLAWQPHMRSRTRLRAAPTRYFVDPSLATAALRASSKDLLNDLNTAGYHFEALVIRDLRIYSQPLDGRVDTWRDSEGNEVDAVVTLDDGRWAAFEVKMSQNDVDKAAATLLRFASRVDWARHGEPAALAVITPSGPAGRRKDGVHVLPITSLAP